MYGKPFNEKRPFGTVHGIAPYAIEQDGNFYNAQKEPVDENGKRLPLAPALEDDPEIPTNTQIVDNPDDDVPADERPFDLLAWAQGDEALKALPYGKVRAEAGKFIEAAKTANGKDALRKAILDHYGAA